MIEELFHIGPVSISPFGGMMVVAFLSAWALLRWGFKRLGVGDEEDASAILLAAGVGGIAGAKIYYAILYTDWRLLFDRSGLVWYGGLIGGALAVVWVMRRRSLSRWPALDAAAPAMALGYAMGRIGCFLVGDDYGRPTDLPWGAKFPHGLPSPTTAGWMRSEYGADIPLDVPASELVAVHPTQLYETLASLAICGIGLWLIKREARPGTAGLSVLALLAVERFLVEFLRAKDDRFLAGALGAVPDLTVAQILSVLVLGVLVVLWTRRPEAVESGV